MSDTINAVSVRAISPLLTAVALTPPAWTRLEPQSVTGDPTPGLEARVHDPLWLLTRQWQFAEFQGDDAGTPFGVTAKTTSTRVTAWRHGSSKPSDPARALPAGEPLDPSIEREPLTRQGLGLRQRAEAGSLLITTLAEQGFDARAALLQACGLAPDSPPPADIPAAMWSVPRLYRTLARTCPDSELAAKSLEAGAPAWLQGASPAAQNAAAKWLAWYRANVSPLAAATPDSWIPERLEYRFAIRAGSGDRQLVFNAPLHDGGTIDWYTFDHNPGAKLALAAEGTAPPPTSRELNMIATPLRYPGMPADRLWQFEDGQVNLGMLETQVHDLARLAFVEFSTVYGCDWFVVPIDVDTGSYTTVDDLSYLTTFGERFHVNPANDQQRSGRFRMFQVSVSGQDTTLPGLLVPPSARGTLEGRALEEVLFLRDESANMAWALEKTVQAASGDPRSRGDEPRTDLAPAGPTPPAELKYILETAVPKYWIPLVPVSTDARSGAFELRKGTLSDHDDSLGMLLDPTPFTLKEEEVPREGVRVRRVPSLLRAADGRYVRWIARRVGVGRGEGSSRLAFDGAIKPRA